MVSHADVRNDETVREQSESFTPLGVLLGAAGKLRCISSGACGRWCSVWDGVMGGSRACVAGGVAGCSGGSGCGGDVSNTHWRQRQSRRRLLRKRRQNLLGLFIRGNSGSDWGGVHGGRGGGSGDRQSEWSCWARMRSGDWEASAEGSGSEGPAVMKRGNDGMRWTAEKLQAGEPKCHERLNLRPRPGWGRVRR